MRINFISDVVKIFIFAATIIIICVLCAVGFKAAQEGKSATTAGTEQLNAMTSEYSNVDISVYDGNTILGSELVNLIKKTIDNKDYLSIVVRTLGSSRTDYNYVYDDVTNSLTGEGTKVIEKSKAQTAYINKGSQFMGSVIKDQNNNIICIWFEQIE